MSTQIKFKYAVYVFITWTCISFSVAELSLKDGSQLSEADSQEALEVLKVAKRIIGGEQVRKGQWPWLVKLVAKVPLVKVWGVPVPGLNRNIHCGASLLNSRWILTAAHCFINDDIGDDLLVAKNWHARLGDVDYTRDVIDQARDFIGKVADIDELRQWNVHLDLIVTHPQFGDRKDLWANDIALARLKEAVPAGEDDIPEIQNITLNTEAGDSFPEIGQECIMKGWGCGKKSGGVQKVARQVKLPILSTECRTLYSVSSTKRICAGHSMAMMGICNGDSGGPLVCKNEDDKWLQVGVASFTGLDNPGEVPGVFTRVSYYTGWIEDTIKDNS